MRTVNDILADHVHLDVECFDRLYLNGYMPALQTGAQLKYFLLRHLGNTIASPVILNSITKNFTTDIEDFIQKEKLIKYRFERKQRKDDIANKIRQKHPREDAVIFVGVAQEKQNAFKASKSKSKKGYVDFHYSRQPVFVNHYYFYINDSDFGPCFIKIGSYAPFPIRVCLNGHEWVKCQLQKRGIAFESLDNGILSCENPQLLQTICDELTENEIEVFFRKWIERLPFPLQQHDISSGYRHELSIWQMEYSRTQVFDRPVRGREFFESVIRDNIDLGRPDRVGLLFDRKIVKSTPGRFQTRVITHGVIPSIHISYKHTDIKQYFKLNRALRTECTINNSLDFGINKNLRNLMCLKTIAQKTNQRLLETQRVSSDCILSEESIERLSKPTVTAKGQKSPGFRLGDSRIIALFAALTLFVHLPRGFYNQQLREHVAALMGKTPREYGRNQMTYDLRRLRLKGIVVRLEGTNRYFLTTYGLHVSLFLTRLHARVLRPGLSALNQDVHMPNPLKKALNNVNTQIDNMLTDAQLKTA